MAIPARPPRASTAATVSSSIRLTQSHSRLLSPYGTSSARWPIAKCGSVPTPVSPPSSRTAFAWSAASSVRVVQRWPAGGTYWRGSSQTGQAEGGSAVSGNWVPQATQIGSVIGAAYGASGNAAVGGGVLAGMSLLLLILFAVAMTLPCLGLWLGAEADRVGAPDPRRPADRRRRR